MILVDTSVWVDHLRADDEVLGSLLERGCVLMHPVVVGELALGHLHNRDTVLTTLQKMSQAMIVSDREVLYFIDRYQLYGLGVGYVDAHLLAAVRMTLGASLWTRDRRLLAAATRLGLATRFES